MYTITFEVYLVFCEFMGQLTFISLVLLHISKFLNSL